MSYQVNVENTIAQSTKLLTMTQLRLLLSNTVLIKNKMDMEKINKDSVSDTLSEELQNDVKYLLIRHIYQCGRDKGVFDFDKDFKISEGIKSIKTRKDFKEFYRYLEEIVAYMKYFEEKNKMNKQTPYNAHNQKPNQKNFR